MDKTVSLTNVGTFKPGMVVNIPRVAADNWIANGDAKVHDGTPWVAPPETMDIPKGMFWCEAHQCLHKLDSGPGKACQKRLAKEAEAKEAAEAAEAEAAAKRKAEAMAEAGQGKSEEEGSEEEEEKARQDAEAEAEAKAKAEAEADEEARRLAEEEEEGED